MQLFEQEVIGKLAVKNRFIRSALWMNGAKDGRVTPELQNVYNALAEGGVGLIISGFIYIHSEDQPVAGMLSLCDDGCIAGLETFTEEIHKRDGRIVAQIAHGGSQCAHPDAARMTLLGPSAVKNLTTGITPKEADRDDLNRVRQLFADAALRAKKAGFDGVQIHAAHGYFLSMFLSPYYNHRTDEYNGTIHDRARIIYETVEMVRDAVGPNFPVLIKVNHDDFMEGDGLVESDAVEMCMRLDQLGIDLIEVSGVNGANGKGIGPARTNIARPADQSYFRESAGKIAARVKTPVALVGGNRSVKIMNQVLNSTGIRFFSLARPLLCEPDLVSRWAVDMGYRPQCVSCNRCSQTTPNSCVLSRRPIGDTMSVCR